MLLLLLLLLLLLCSVNLIQGWVVSSGWIRNHLAIFLQSIEQRNQK